MSDPTASHHRPRGSQNRYADFQPKRLGEVLRWRWQAWRRGLPPRAAAPTPAVSPRLDVLQGYAAAPPGRAPQVTWVGHSTVLAQLGGLSLLTDPIFSERASPLSFAGPKRLHPPGVSMAQLPPIDVVLVSHNHYDHLDAASVRALARQSGGSPLFVVPLGLRRWFERRGLPRVVELDWWQSHAVATPRGQAEVMLVPSHHWSTRGPHDTMATLWGGFAVLAADCHLYYAGDTAYSPDFADIRRHLAPRQQPQHGGGFDLALLPIGAYEPRWFMRGQHIDVTEALQIHRDLGAQRSLGIHWGTFSLTDEAPDEPPRRLLAERAGFGLGEDDFFVMALGETRALPPRRPLPQAG